MPKFLKFLLFLILVVLAISIISSLIPSSKSQEQDPEPVSESVSETEVANLGTVIIDAGHGGHQ